MDNTINTNKDSAFNIEKHLREIKEIGYAVVPNFLTKDECNQLIQHLETLDVQRFNTNELGGQYSGAGFFEQRLTAKKSLIYKILLDPFLQKVFRGIFCGRACRVISTRLYQITGGFRYSFHTDNKRDAQKREMAGLACVIYLNDTDDGALEVYDGSHLDSHEILQNTVKSDFLNARYGADKHKRLPGTAGTLVICDIRTFHGSKQEDTKKRAYRLWFQVNDDLSLGERILIDPALIERSLTPDEMTFLGFGLPNISMAYPKTSYVSAPLSVFWANLGSLLACVPKSIIMRMKAAAIARFRRH